MTRSCCVKVNFHLHVKLSFSSDKVKEIMRSNPRFTAENIAYRLKFINMVSYTNSSGRSLNRRFLNSVNSKLREIFGNLIDSTNRFSHLLPTRSPSGGIIWIRDPKDFNRKKLSVYSIEISRIEDYTTIGGSRALKALEKLEKYGIKHRDV